MERRRKTDKGKRGKREKANYFIEQLVLDLFRGHLEQGKLGKNGKKRKNEKRKKWRKKIATFSRGKVTKSLKFKRTFTFSSARNNQQNTIVTVVK